MDVPGRFASLRTALAVGLLLLLLYNAVEFTLRQKMLFWRSIVRHFEF